MHGDRMDARSLISILFLLFLCNSVSAEIIGKEVEYASEGTTFKGYLAYDNDIKGNRPGVIVVHEWWGHNEYARKRARMLAKLGYSAIALDMYGDGKQARHPKDAGRFSSAIRGDLPEAEKRFQAAYQLLQQQSQTDKDQIGAIGYCFGGGIVLAMARRGVDLKGVVSFHGSPNVGAPAAKGKIKSSVLVLNGEADVFIKPTQIKAFKEEMNNAGVDYEFVNYRGAKHAFTNPEADKFGKKFSIPLKYDNQADIQSWEKMQSFFKRVFK